VVAEKFHASRGITNSRLKDLEMDVVTDEYQLSDRSGQN
jgi:hypothetical protein